MTSEVLAVSKFFMRKPVIILVKKEELTLEGIKQFFVYIEREEWKLDTLCDLYDTLSITQAVIFCNTRRKVDMLTQNMKEKDFTVSSMVSPSVSSVCPPLLACLCSVHRQSMSATWRYRNVGASLRCPGVPSGSHPLCLPTLARAREG